MNTCNDFDHDFVPLIQERDEKNDNETVHRRCCKCGMVTDDRKMAAKVQRILEAEPAQK